MSSSTTDPTLPCGAATDDLLEQAVDTPDAPLTPHQRACQWCRPTLTEFHELFAPLRRAVAEPVAVPPTLIDQVVRRIRALVDGRQWVAVEGPDGRIRVAVTIVLRTVNRSAEEVDGVRGSLAALVGETDRAAGADIVVASDTAGAGLSVRLDLAVDFGIDLHRLADTVRERVSDQLAASGVPVSAVDVHVDDLLL